MDIQVVSVGQPQQISKNGKAWDEIEINYISKNGPANRKIKSFEGEVFKQVKSLKEGDNAKVTLLKEGNFWNWKDVQKDAAAPAVLTITSLSAPQAAKKTGDWETSDERAKKQYYIVRQSSISSAIAYFNSGNQVAHSVEEILEVAKKFEEFVFSGEVPQAEKKPRGRPAKQQEAEPEEMQ